MKKKKRKQKDGHVYIGLDVTIQQHDWLVSKAEEEDRSKASIIRQLITAEMRGDQ